MAEEKIFENIVKIFLNDKYCWYIKFWGGSQFTKAGIPDLLCCINGIFVAIELKSKNGKVSELQKIQIERIKKSGGIGLVIYPHDFDKFKKLVEVLMKCNLAIHEWNHMCNVLTNIN